MAILQLDHVSLLVTDARPVLEFYGRFLGFEVAGERAMPDQDMRIIDLRRGRDFVEVIESSGGDPARSGGIKHVAFRSDDIDADFATFQDSGARLLHQEVQRGEAASFFFVRSPGGEWVEIIEYASEPSC